ncbi:hypothetical protein SBRY_50476 [Actinacidiphila bryophytorum]|uniref:RNA polymerase sigma-70 region 2 domain-containing protein n=1 Tax=Actinacidiphila bryophytorum TaxID=1436133 RepID=A0A9W4H514_9ACTN|nr:hypothetical protein SBRY_50476 [Actinacidiphila bryophytorum]
MTTPVCTSASTTQFTAYVRTKGPTLLRTARSLTPNPADAEDLLQTALTKTYLAWDRIDDHRAVDGYVRRTLVNTRTSQWRKRKVDEFSTDELPEPAPRRRSRPHRAAGAARRPAARDIPAPPAPAGHGRTPLLRGHERGADRGDHGRVDRHRQERGLARTGQAARRPRAGAVRGLRA